MKEVREVRVYVIGPNVGPQKIGVTGETSKRLRGLRGANPVELTLHFELKTEPFSARLVERTAHSILSEKRLAGEWFDVTPQEAEAAVLTAFDNVRKGIPMAHADKHHNLSTRLTKAQYDALESYRARHGLRSLNQAVGHMIDATEKREGGK